MITFAFTSLFISQNILVDFISAEQIIIEDVASQDPELPFQDPLDKMGTSFPKAIVPYYIETSSYDSIIVSRIQTAMDMIETSSCVIFKRLQFKPIENSNTSWVHVMNPEEVRDCVHEPGFGPNREITIILGYECMMLNNIVHAMLHAIGFKDEVSHPHRDQYIRIMWENIQPRYRKLFQIQREDEPYKTVEYDPMSIMHYHDRAFSINGGPTIAPRVPGLLINPSDKLSQLDVMKLRLWYGHECNKRKVGALLEKCKTVLHNSPSVPVVIVSDEYVSNKNVEVDLAGPYEDLKDQHGTPPDYRDMDNEYDANTGEVDAGGDYGNEGTVGRNEGMNADFGTGVNGNNGDYEGEGDDASVKDDFGSDSNGTGGKEVVNLGEGGVDLTEGAKYVDGHVRINEIPHDGVSRKVKKG